ncbi:MAG: endopeptidase La [Oscillospiraceae bacterium]|jgi:ATP-dependent Lon protease|nr:endopeptidase La [Oscillospiraceae bacterium]
MKNDKTTTQKATAKTITLPALAMRDIVIFPKMLLHFDVGREKSSNALRAAADSDRKIFLVTQKDTTVVNPEVDDMYTIGVIAEIRQLLRTPDGNVRVLAEGVSKAKLVGVTETDPYLLAEVSIIKETKRKNPPETEALMRILREAFKAYATYMPKMQNDFYEAVLSEPDLGRLIDAITFNVYLKAPAKQRVLECTSLKKTAEILATELQTELNYLKTQLDIESVLNESFDHERKQLFLKEQLQIIQNQLNGDNGKTPPQDANGNPIAGDAEMNKKISELPISDESKGVLYKQSEKISLLSPGHPDYYTVKSYLDEIIDFPWGVCEQKNITVKQAEKILNSEHYGLKKVKERLLEYIAVNILRENKVAYAAQTAADKVYNKTLHIEDLDEIEDMATKASNAAINKITPSKSNIICLVGPPGVGKTSIGKSAATALGRSFARISLGGVHDEAEIRGHRKTYIGSMPGSIVKAIERAGCVNPVILLDEIDKLSSDYKGDPASALLEALDPEQNKEFRDHYFEIPIDLSKVIFITTANNAGNIPEPLYDRMEIIELGSYTREEKYKIASKFLFPKQLEENCVSLSYKPDVLRDIIEHYTREAGVRRLEQQIAKLCRKVAKDTAELPQPEWSKHKPKITLATLPNYLGSRKFKADEIPDRNEVGTVNGLAWTSAGGTLLPLEVLILEGSGKTEVTGNLGEVMTESAKIAMSVARNLAHEFNIAPDFYTKKDIHIHAPEGAIPKDGPSAGVALTTCLISALSGIPIKRDIAMTGEITLRGKVLQIGGLREKSAAAYKAGVTTVIIPESNLPDLEEVDDEVKEHLRFVPAKTISDVLSVALIRDKAIIEPSEPIPVVC